jgi:hypothetical protein
MPVRPGLVPGIHAVTLRVSLRTQTVASASASAMFWTVGLHGGVDGRDKPGHDEQGWRATLSDGWRPLPRFRRSPRH